MSRKPSAVSGILLLDKPTGMTSTAALSRAKRCLDERKAGHTGALDPMATGLLPLCFGEATKISAFLLDADKAYEAELLLGVRTRSGDADGEVCSNAPVPQITAAGLEPILERFRGPILQVPPMVSALKHQGKRLHQLARAGIEIERPPRPVRIDRLELLALELPRARIRVECSKGTYIRSLAMDIGELLGCGAHLTALRRTRSGPFTLSDAHTLEHLQDLSIEQARGLLLPPDAALPEWLPVALEPAQAAEVAQGRPVSLGLAAAAGVRMYCEGRFLGLGRIDPDGMLKVRRLFHMPA
ncbi:MAG: tRNA pseudouridine(55) synthase TruB [Gammaproteobacteria bacterium HGW-Gammaproteobacteria-8]|nr:MAG: tRNA pseudouridine(55) synthase TruB [Gammaproteobacteria bacterium HGW-Gammaproteobacteria-8]